MAKQDILKVEGEHITLHGKPILLKGERHREACWLTRQALVWVDGVRCSARRPMVHKELTTVNMENFITGFPGHEYQVRRELKKVLGEEKYEYFFDKFLEYFFTESDAKLFAELGFNCLRLPVNYRHFEDDMNPRVFKKEGLKHLDRVVDLCAKYGIYTVIDLHALPGGHNIDWHSDNSTHEAPFWDHKDFQDRAIIIWEHLAEHYNGNSWVAGYNPVNEPTDKEHLRLIAFYERVEKAIRAIDPDHILFLDAETQGTPEQITFHEKAFARKVEYMRKYHMPIWNGEFGPVYNNPSDGADWQEVNTQRYNVLKTQLEIYARDNASWSIWLWKDIGYQGMVYCGEDTAYMKLLKPFLEKKKRLAADAWGCNDDPVRHIFDPLDKWILEAVPGIKNRYPSVWHGVKYNSRLIRNILLSDELCPEYASYFKDKSLEELDELAKSFSLENCKQRTELNNILTADTKRDVK